MSLIIRVLPAYHGDCIHITYQENGVVTNILVDGGIKRTYPQFLKHYLREIKTKGQLIDLLIVTHYDSDHIGGINELFDDADLYNDGFIKEVWFNSGKLISKYLKGKKVEFAEASIELAEKEISVKEGITLERKLESLACWTKEIIKTGFIYELNKAKIEVISPYAHALKKINKKWQIEEDKQKKIAARSNDYDVSIPELVNKKFYEDKNPFNKSSIAFILYYKNKRILMSGDAFPSQIMKSLIKNKIISTTNKLKLDLLKLAHHGSKKNTSPEFLKHIDCSHFIISTDGNNHGLPDKECLARIINSQEPGVTFYFNYENENNAHIFTKEELSTYNVNISYLNRNNYQIEFA